MSTGTLYLVATPIGNLGDLSHRACNTLAEVDFIAAEDTRVSQKLLQHLGLQKPMVSYFEHNRRKRGEEIVAQLQAGQSCALLTDAGTPAISDPGEDLVALCHTKGIPCVPIPGACAAVCALASSGLPSGRWCFEGFLSVHRRSRKEHLESLVQERRTMIFYEAPHKLRQTLEDLCAYFGADRAISISRELTKLHEQTFVCTLGEAIEHFAQTAPRGEFVLVVAGCAPIEQDDSEEAMAQAIEQVQAKIASGMTQKDAIKEVSARLGVKKNALYGQVLKQEKQENALD